MVDVLSKITSAASFLKNVLLKSFKIFLSRISKMDKISFDNLNIICDWNTFEAKEKFLSFFCFAVLHKFVFFCCKMKDAFCAEENLDYIHESIVLFPFELYWAFDA